MCIWSKTRQNAERCCFLSRLRHTVALQEFSSVLLARFLSCCRTTVRRHFSVLHCGFIVSLVWCRRELGLVFHLASTLKTEVTFERFFLINLQKASASQSVREQTLACIYDLHVKINDMELFILSFFLH